MRFLAPSALLLVVALVGGRNSVPTILLAFAAGAIGFGVTMTIVLTVIAAVHRWRNGKRHGRERREPRKRVVWISTAGILAAGLFAYASGGPRDAAFLAGYGPGLAFFMLVMNKVTGLLDTERN